MQGRSVDESNGGIGIVPYVYQQAYNYYYNLFITQSLNKDKDIKGIVGKTKEITIPPPKVKEKKRFFNIAEDEVI